MRSWQRWNHEGCSEKRVEKKQVAVSRAWLTRRRRTGTGDGRRPATFEILSGGNPELSWRAEFLSVPFSAVGTDEPTNEACGMRLSAQSRVHPKIRRRLRVW